MVYARDASPPVIAPPVTGHCRITG
jgi:hypothetical protein